MTNAEKEHCTLIMQEIKRGDACPIPSLDIRESPLGISRDPPGIRVTESGIPNSSIVTRVIFKRTGSLQTRLNAGLSEQQQEDLFQR